MEILLRDQWSGPVRPVRAIHPADEMLQRDLWNPEQAEVEYFHTGLLAARTLAPVLVWQQKRLDRPIRVLDFAAGYGRVTRFLPTLSADLELRVSDVEPAAVEFQRQVRLWGLRASSRLLSRRRFRRTPRATSTWCSPPRFFRTSPRPPLAAG